VREVGADHFKRVCNNEEYVLNSPSQSALTSHETIREKLTDFRKILYWRGLIEFISIFSSFL
jgi:hypothetical protein